jgi:AcrR family transcriptional regulator
MPKIVTEADVERFRERLCKAATRRFARFGYDGVTMRQLADDLGCSPKTPYRYFKDKDEILAVVRAAAFGRFADALEHAAADLPPQARGSAVVRAYVEFARANPDQYRLMFDVRRPEDVDHPELQRQSTRAQRFITRQAKELVAAGVFEGDPVKIGYAMWAGLHGVVVLDLAGMLGGHAPDAEVVRHELGRLMQYGALKRDAGAKKGGTAR